jgi:hypothetical protein
MVIFNESVSISDAPECTIVRTKLEEEAILNLDCRAGISQDVLARTNIPHKLS